MNRELLLSPKNQNEESGQMHGTRMENFAPLAGSVVVFGYDLLGEVAGVSLEVREILDDKGGRAKGALVTVKQDQYQTQNSFIDEDELPELIKGFDAILSVKQNPTSFKFFEVKYTPRGEFQLIAFNNQNGFLVYGVKAGRGGGAQVFNLQAQHIQRIKDLFEKAETKLNSLKQ